MNAVETPDQRRVPHRLSLRTVLRSAPPPEKESTCVIDWSLWFGLVQRRCSP
jgi:hypothetical protein